MKTAILPSIFLATAAIASPPDAQTSVLGPDRGADTERAQNIERRPSDGMAIPDGMGDCLAEPSRSCALKIALEITADEDLSIERSKVLLVLAETLHQLGDTDRARETARLAKEEAENIGISLGTEQKLVEIAPVEARIGAMDEMRRSLENINDPFMRSDAVAAVVHVLAGRGDGETIGELLPLIDQPIRAVDHALGAAMILIDGGHESAARAVIEAVQPRLDDMRNPPLRAMAQARLAAAYARLGDGERARALLAPVLEKADDFQMRQDRAAVQAAISIAHFNLGDIEAYEDRITAAQDLATGGIIASYDRDTALNALVRALAVGDRFDEAAAAAAKVSSIRQRIALLTMLADLADDAHDRQLVAGLSAGLVESLAENDSRFERDMARYAVVRAMAKIGHVEPAMDAIAAMEDNDDQARALAYIARALN